MHHVALRWPWISPDLKPGILAPLSRDLIRRLKFPHLHLELPVGERAEVLKTECLRTPPYQLEEQVVLEQRPAETKRVTDTVSRGEEQTRVRGLHPEVHELEDFAVCPLMNLTKAVLATECDVGIEKDSCGRFGVTDLRVNRLWHTYSTLRRYRPDRAAIQVCVHVDAADGSRGLCQQDRCHTLRGAVVRSCPRRWSWR